MAAGDLVFKHPARGDGLLIFGGGDGPDIDVAELHVDAEFAPLDASIRIDTPPPDGVHLLEVDAELPGLDANIRLTAIRIAELGLDAALPELQASIGLSVDPSELHLDASFPELQANVAMLWDPNVSRVDLRVELVAGWQEASPERSATSGHWQQADSVRGAVRSGWQEAAHVQRSARVHWQQADSLRHAVRSHWQEAAPMVHVTRGHWQEALRLRHAASGHWQEGMQMQHAVVARWQETERLRHAVRSAWQEAAPVRALLREGFGHGLPVRIRHRHWWQEAMRPRSGVSPDPHQPRPPKETCFDPDKLGELVFRTFKKTGAQAGELVFICWRHAKRPIVVVPRRRVYVIQNDIVLRRLDGNVLIPCDTLQMSLDESSWTWSWSATVRRQSMPDLEPSAHGVPVVLEAVVNGVSYRLVAESRSRNRRFAETRIDVSGRGLAAALDAPYAHERHFGNPAGARMAQQLMLEALTENEVSIGWGVDWGLTDWEVPQGVWSHQGTYIGAINAIAAAAGGYVQPHATAQTLRILHRYPVAPWNWDDVTPGVELPQDVVTVEGAEWITKPDYDRVFVSGMAGGISRQVTRAGRAGTLIAPMATDALITDNAAAVQRGRAVLSDTGAQVNLSITLPVLPATGVITPGTFLRRVDADNGETLQGYVRGVSLNWERPKLRQTLEVQCHV